MNKIQRTTTAELSTMALRQQILNRELLPGTRITEDAMAKELGISRATVRQALNSLVQEGLLVRNPTTRVLEVLSLNAAEISDIYQARLVLELAGVEASKSASQEALLRLKQAVTEMVKAAEKGDVLAFVEADMACHAQTVMFLNSRLLSETHSTLMGRLRLAMTQLKVDEGLTDHQEFCDLIMDGKTDEAKQNLVARLTLAEREVLDNLNQSSPQTPENLK